jgi:hypothetical protein
MVIYHDIGTFPRGFLPEYTIYDGNSSRWQTNPRIVHHVEGYYHCGRCSESFYGDSYYICDCEENWCTHCTDHHAHFCDENDEYYADPDNMPYSEDHEDRGGQVNQESDTVVNGFRIYPGEATTRFLSKPLVGIEFEHAPTRADRRETSGDALYTHMVMGRDASGTRWSERIILHGDGSIKFQDGYSSSEIVTMPSSGDKLEEVIDRFYYPFASGTFTPGPEHHSCGFHMHVASEYLFLMKRGLVDGSTNAFSKAMLKDISKICMEFVSSSRRTNTYCGGPVAVRDKNRNQAGTKEMIRIFGVGGYPSLAVRTFGTIEFRIWPSSNSIRNTKARAELSQKLIAYFDRATTDSGAFRQDQAMADSLHAIAVNCSGGARTSVPSQLGSLLDLSPECVSALVRMSQRFNPFTSKATVFKFSDRQIAAMDNENTEAGISISGLDSSRLSCVGDTTALYNRDTWGHGEEYIAFGVACKCYNEEDESQMPDLVAKLAKGEV